jgi:hypothetical protein
VSPAHGVGAALPPGHVVPIEQGAHAVGVVAVPDGVSDVPAAQTPWSWHVVWFGPDEYVPSAQVPHTWSRVAVPEAATYWPAVHVVQVAQVAALATSVNVPEAHAAQA